jgi:peptide/nickel transport system ATP-binding protein
MMLLDVKKLKLHYQTVRGNVRAVDDISFSINKGETMGIVGESGCGKSSTANAIMRLLPKNTALFEGTVHLDGEDITALNDNEFRRKVRWKKISIIFQGAMNSLNPVLKSGFQVAEPLIFHQRTNRKEALEKASYYFKEVGLPPEFIDRYPHELSGGMKQRVVIAMALILNPDLIILDEPTSALDVSIQAQIMNLLKDIKRETKASMIFITHDIALASDLCDNIAVMYGGEMVEIDTIEGVLETPKHPYTQRLIASVPLLRGDKFPEFILGTPPDLVNPPSGCRFHPRCPHVMEKCKSETPTDFKSNGKLVKCWLME